MKKLSQSLMAQTIIAKRKEKKMTQQQLSDATGINRAVISRMESLEFIVTNTDTSDDAWTISFKYNSDDTLTDTR